MPAFNVNSARVWVPCDFICACVRKMACDSVTGRSLLSISLELQKTFPSLTLHTHKHNIYYFIKRLWRKGCLIGLVFTLFVLFRVLCVHVFFCFVAYLDCRKFEMLFKLTQNAKLTDTSLIYSPSAVCLMLCCYYLLPSQQRLIYVVVVVFFGVLVVFVAHCQPILLLPLFCSVYCVCVFLSCCCCCGCLCCCCCQRRHFIKNSSQRKWLLQWLLFAQIKSPIQQSSTHTYWHIYEVYIRVVEKTNFFVWFF